ncbi:MAG: hypothetical protein PHS62_04775 [Patescibacteria group bacterium]|nr:hypothetical protein [Patescibacteria group bacterium]
MFFNTPGKPTNLKKAVYLAASVILGLLLGLIAHAAIEMKYLALADSRGWAVNFYYGCALPIWLQILIWLAGVVGGYFLGSWWWRKLYVERVWEKK